MEKWFLYRVYKLNKRLFAFFMLFLAGTVFTSISGWQATPFFVWGMYSEKENTHTEREVWKVTVNDSQVINYTGYTDANKFFLRSPVWLYIFMRRNNAKDPTALFLERKLGDNPMIQNLGEKVLNGPTEYSLFLPWYKRYLEQTSGMKIHSYTIEVLKTGFTDKNKLEIYSAELIDAWKQ
jgi:hypothetical protein